MSTYWGLVWNRGKHVLYRDYIGICIPLSPTNSIGLDHAGVAERWISVCEEPLQHVGRVLGSIA